MIFLNKQGLLLLTATTLACISHNSSATCSRDDVEFYLNKGFSTSQITSLCDTAATEKNKASPLPATTTSQQHQTPTNSTETFLREAIKGRNILLSKDTLSYTLKMCVNYGAEDLYGFAPETCPNVRFSIAFNGLVIKQPEQKLFFQPDQIEVMGTITRKVVDGLEKFNPEVQQLILKKLETGNKTAIPIRDDISIDQAFRVLEQLTQ